MDLGTLSPGVVIILVVGVALAPFVAVMVTSFTKIVIVLSLLRNALGLQQTPPNVVLNGLAIILSIYIMSPVLTEVYASVEEGNRGTQQEEELTLERMVAIVGHAQAPMREFLIRHSSDTERSFFLDSAQRIMPEESAKELTADSFLIVIPAFVIAELAEAFQIGFLIYLPFLIIDLVVSNLLMALGMIMMPPTLVSLPFKLLLFILLDGWSKLVHGLVVSYL